MNYEELGSYLIFKWEISKYPTARNRGLGKEVAGAGVCVFKCQNGQRKSASDTS